MEDFEMDQSQDMAINFDFIDEKKHGSSGYRLPFSMDDADAVGLGTFEVDNNLTKPEMIRYGEMKVEAPTSNHLHDIDSLPDEQVRWLVAVLHKLSLDIERVELGITDVWEDQVKIGILGSNICPAINDVLLEFKTYLSGVTEKTLNKFRFWLGTKIMRSGKFAVLEKRGRKWISFKSTLGKIENIPWYFELFKDRREIHRIATKRLKNIVHGGIFLKAFDKTLSKGMADFFKSFPKGLFFGWVIVGSIDVFQIIHDDEKMKAPITNLLADTGADLLKIGTANVMGGISTLLVSYGLGIIATSFGFSVTIFTGVILFAAFIGASIYFGIKLDNLEKELFEKDALSKLLKTWLGYIIEEQDLVEVIDSFVDELEFVLNPGFYKIEN